MGILRHTGWVVSVFALAASVQAMPITSLVFDPVKINSSPVEFDLADHSTVTGNGDGSFHYVGAYTASDDWSAVWEVDVSGEEWRNGSNLFIFATIELTSMVATASDFGVLVTLPGTIPGPTTISGSVSGSVADTSGDGNGAALTENSDGLPFYNALIDGVSVRTLLSDPFTFTAPAWLTNPWDGGDYVNEAPHPAVTQDIAIDHNFRLSGFESVTVTSTMLVVPEPATLAFLLIGGSALALRRRR